MITLKFTNVQARELLEENPNDRLGQHLLALVLPKPDASVILFAEFINRTANGFYWEDYNTLCRDICKAPTANKIALIKAARELSRISLEFRNSISRNTFPNGIDGPWGLVETKNWVEKNLDAIGQTIG